MKSILILEDEELISSVLEKRLINENYQVVLSNDVNQALKIISKGTVDLIILDLDIPDSGAFTFLSKKNKESKSKKIPVLVISNSGRVGELGRAKELGATDWVLKTEFDPKDIVLKTQKIFKAIKISS